MSSCISVNFVYHCQGFVVIFGVGIQRFGDFPKQGGKHWISCSHGGKEKELGVPTPQSGWWRIQVGMGQKQEKEMGRERGEIQHGGVRLGGGRGQLWSTVLQTLRSQCPEIWGCNISDLEVILPNAFWSHCPRLWGHTALHFGVKTFQNWGTKCTILKGHHILHFGV